MELAEIGKEDQCVKEDISLFIDDDTYLCGNLLCKL